MPIPGTRLWAAGETLTAANLIRYLNNVVNALAGRSGPVQLEDSLEVIAGSNGNRYVKLPGGTTAQRPGIPTESMIRYNITTKEVEFYNGEEWVDWVGGRGPVLRFNVDGIRYSSGWNRRSWNAYIDISKIILYDRKGAEGDSLVLSPRKRVRMTATMINQISAPSGFGQYARADVRFSLREEDMPSQIDTGAISVVPASYGSLLVPRIRIGERRNDDEVGFRFWRSYSIRNTTPEAISWSGSSPNRRLNIQDNQTIRLDSGGIGARNIFSIFDELVTIGKASGNPGTVPCEWVQFQYIGRIKT